MAGMTGDARTGHGRLTAAVEVELFERLLEAAVVGRTWDDLNEVIDGLRERKPLHDDIARALLETPAGDAAGEWADLLRHMAELLVVYSNLKHIHGPQEFRRILWVLLDEATCMQLILDEQEREALGLAGALKGGGQHAA